MQHTNKTCGECVLMQHSGGVCPIFKRKLEAHEPGCPAFSSQFNACQLCGNHITPGQELYDMTNPDHMYIYCRGCQQHMGHCPTCSNSRECLFETDPSSLPKVVQKEIRQGNMVQIAQIRNPDRIRETCQKGCSCYSEEFECLRQINTCGNYKCILEV